MFFLLEKEKKLEKEIFCLPFSLTVMQAGADTT
jgi:hypothetical protein